MTAAALHEVEPVDPAPAGRWPRARIVRWSVIGVGLVAFAIWAKVRIDGLSTSTQATNPIIKWEYLFDRERTPEELWERTSEHLRLTVGAVGVGFAIACLLSAVAIRFRWTFGPITFVTGFLYTIPSIALFSVLTAYVSNFVAAEIALTGYTLLILVRNIVAGIDGVPSAVTDAADGMGMGRLRRLLTVEVPIALPVIVTGVRVATVTTIGLVGISAIIQLGGLGSLIFDGYGRQYTTLIVIGSALSIALAVGLDLALTLLGRLLTPWTREVRR